MCGFAGVVSFEDRFRTEPHTLARMSCAVAHRGPDGEGTYYNHHHEVRPGRAQCALTFRRLAILDPDPRAMQPYHLLCQHGRPRLSLVFNGEIYNFRELRAELSHLRPDHAWRTTGDTEVLLLAYDVWRERCLERLNGMFALAIWDERDQSLFLARDRMGQKPLYVVTPDITAAAPVVAFASELGALKALPWFDRRLNDRALADYLAWGYVGGESTIYLNADKVAPALWRRYAAGREAGDGYYFSPNDLPPRADAAAPADPAADTRRLVTEAVRRQLVADVPLGCFLSGGVDSSVVTRAMVAAAEDPKRVLTFSIAFDDPRYDESAHAREVAAHLGTTHHEFRVTPDAAADLPRLAKVYGEPFADSSALPTHYLSRETRKHVKVALSGDGGDELFGGYDRYLAMSAEKYLRRVPPPLIGLMVRLAAQTSAGHPKSLRSRVHRFLATADLSAGQRYASYMRLFDPKLLADLWPATKDAHKPADLAGQYAALAKTRDPVEAALALDRWTYLPDDLLAKVDRASMLHNLEVRSPFMDPDVLRFAAYLTSEQLLKGGPKRLLREAFAPDLPEPVFSRRKMGFAVPIGDWFRSSLKPMLRDHLLATDSFCRERFSIKTVERLLDDHDRELADHSQRLYALLMLELWWRTAR